MCMNWSDSKANVVLVLLTTVLCWGSVTTTGYGQETPTPPVDKIDVATYTGMCRLRKAIHLTDETLAAAGCSESDATKALDALLTWRQSNAVQIEANRKANIKAAKDLRLALQKIGMEPRDEALLATIPSLKTALAAAIKERNDLVKAAVAAAESQLSTSQKNGWATVRKNIGRRKKYRYAPDLTAGQSKALHIANRSYARRMAAAKTAAGKAAVTSQFTTAEGGILSAAQKTAMAAAQINIAAKKADVLKAAEAVMPMPAELKQEPELDPNDPMAIIKKYLEDKKTEE